MKEPFLLCLQWDFKRINKNENKIYFTRNGNYDLLV